MTFDEITYKVNQFLEFNGYNAFNQYNQMNRKKADLKAKEELKKYKERIKLERKNNKIEKWVKLFSFYKWDITLNFYFFLSNKMRTIAAILIKHQVDSKTNAGKLKWDVNDKTSNIEPTPFKIWYKIPTFKIPKLENK